MWLNLKELSKVNASRCVRWHGQTGLMGWSPERWLVAITGEFGEMAEALEGVEEKIEPSQMMLNKLAEEAADTIIYTELMAQRIAYDLNAELTPFDIRDNCAFYFIRAVRHLGEASNALKKVFRVQDGMANISEPDRQILAVKAGVDKIGNELGRFAEMIWAICEVHDIDLKRSIKIKFNSTSEKYGFPERMT